MTDVTRYVTGRLGRFTFALAGNSSDCQCLEDYHSYTPLVKPYVLCGSPYIQPTIIVLSLCYLRLVGTIKETTVLDKTHNSTLVNSMKTFGERLRHARHRAQISQESLADKVGVTKGAVSQWENDITQGCKNEVLFLISDVLLADARWLATGHGEPDLTVEMPHHIALAKAIDRIPKDAREPLVKLIQSMSQAAEERFWKWAKEVG